MALLYEGGVRLRNALFEASLLRRRRLSRPVISVGNITMGGTGKTPLVIHIANTIARAGAVPVLLSRGYGRKTRIPVLLPPGETARDAADLLGDEPAIIRRHVPQIWLGIAPDRHLVGERISRRVPGSVFILDDGFQHRRLHRDLDLVVVDASRPLSENRMFPRGTLREPLAGLNRAQLIIVNGAPSSPGVQATEAFLSRNSPGIPLFHCRQQISRLVPMDAWRGAGAEDGRLVEKNMEPAFLVAAVGNPERFLGAVRALGVDIRGSRFFRDHYRPDSSEWARCIREARLAGAGALITTEKDAIKIGADLDFPMLVAVQSTDLVEQAELERLIGSLLEGNG